MMPVKRTASRKAPGSDSAGRLTTAITIARRDTSEAVLNAAQLEFIKQFMKNETNSKTEEEPKINTNIPQSQASRGRFTETVKTTLSAAVHFLLTLTVLVVHVLNNTYEFAIGLVIILAKSTTRMVTAVILAITILALVLGEMVGLIMGTVRVIYRNLKTVLRKIFNTINEIFGVDMIVVKSDQTRNQMVESNKMFKAAMTRKTLNMDLVQRQTVTKRNTLTVIRKEIISQCIDKQTVTECEEKLETSERIFTDIPKSNVQAIEDQMTGNISNSRNVELVSSPYVRPAVSRRVNKLVKWRRGRYFGDGTPTATTESSRRQDCVTDDRITTVANRNATTERINPSMNHYRPTQHHRHWQGPNVMPRHQSTDYSRTWNYGFNAYVPPMTTVPPAPVPRFGRVWNGYRYCDVLLWPRMGQFRQDHRAFGAYPAPPMFHRWPYTNFGQNAYRPHYGYRPEYPGLYNTYNV